MTWGLRVLPAADADVDELAAYIARDSVEQAMRFYDAVAATYEIIAHTPSRWPLYGFTSAGARDLRKHSVLKFPNHLIFYRIDADMVEIVRVLHGARDFPTIFAPPRSPE